MSQTNFDKTTAATQPTQQPAELNERELNHVTGGLLPAVGPAAKPLVPAV